MPKRVVKRYVEYESSEEEEQVAAPEESESSEEEVIIRRKKKRAPTTSKPKPAPAPVEPEQKDYSVQELIELAQKHFQSVYATEIRNGNGIKKKGQPKDMKLVLKTNNNFTNKTGYDVLVTSKDNSVANYNALVSTKSKLDGLGYVCKFQVHMES